MGLFRSLTGQVRVALTCADIAKGLSEIRALGIPVTQVQYVDDLCLHFTVTAGQWGKLTALAERKGWKVEQTQHQGIFWKLMGLTHRPVLVTGMTFLLLVSLFLPGRILFVQVEGNCAVPTKLILEVAAKHGVCLGASGRELRSERIKNALLDEIPQLQWLGVNAKGCVAVISVRERQLAAQEDPLTPVTNMVAKADGMIQSVTVTQGTALCKPGDAVVEGQMLISGYSDLGICLHGTQAKGEIFALTKRSVTACTPSSYQIRARCSGRKIKYGLLIGNKRINFYKSSGILDASCARIYSVWYMTLPGGFQLPIGIVQETWLEYDTVSSQAVCVDLADAAKRYLLQQLTEGQILVSHSATTEDDSVLTFRGNYVCREMLGRIQIEEN